MELKLHKCGSRDGVRILGVVAVVFFSLSTNYSVTLTVFTAFEENVFHVYSAQCICMFR